MTPAESACVALAEGCGYHVFPFSRAAKAQIPDVPDLLLTHSRGVVLFWECKVGRDKLTRGQFQFLDRVLNANGLAGCGTREHLKIVLDLCARSLGHTLAAARCRVLVDCLASAGFRGERK